MPPPYLPEKFCDDSTQCTSVENGDPKLVSAISSSIIRQGLDINNGKLIEVVGALGAISTKLDTLATENKTLRESIEKYSHAQIDDLAKFINNRFDQMPSAIIAEEGFKAEIDKLKKDIIEELNNKYRK